MQKFYPGKKRILNSLQESPKGFTALHEDTKLNKNYLNKYLKELWEDGLIGRDIQTREYFIEPISYASLLINNVRDFMKDYLEKAINEDLKKGINIYSRSILLSEHINFFWLFLLDKKYQNELQDDYMQVLKKNPETLTKLTEISETIENVYESYVLSTYTPKQREIIETYKRYLLEIGKKFYANSHEEEQKGVKELFLSVAEYKLNQEYPNMSVKIPEEMIRIKAEGYLKELEKAADMILYPHDWNDLIFRLKRWDALGDLRKEEDFTKKDKKEIEEMLSFLENSKHKKLHEIYISRCSNPPKSLLIYPSLGFKGYLEKLKEFPDIFKKQMVEGLEEKLEKMLKEQKEKIFG